MPSKDIIVMGLAVWLVLRLTSNQRVANVAPIAQSNNQNADLWLKTGALNLGGQLLKEIGRGGFANIFTPSTAAATGDSFLPPGANDYVGDVFTGGYDLGVGTA